MATKKSSPNAAPKAQGKGFGFLSVPKDIGNDDLPLIDGTARATLTKLHPGTSAAQKPKLTLEFQITEPVEGYEDEYVLGSKVLETCSLQPQALWKLNDYYKAVKGENIPAGDYETVADFVAVLEPLLETEWDLLLTIGTVVGGSGGERTEVKKASFVG